ncbi:unnamed protein product [Miscanthus lutarioriparius]|uniref:Pentatricopeptide repeat-containing protein n=1 Tax=Miscanthus lutarioriparius TaxID=422564 RepID=A0A811QCW5_9POAL|nr:unnamed protein product [Miscanthus lutarioriparius]
MHAAMIASGRLAEALSPLRLLTATLRSPQIPAAARLRAPLLSSLPCTPNSFTLNTTLRVLASSPDPAAAFPFFSRLRVTGALAPGRPTFPFLLKAAARLPLPLPVTEQLHALAVRHGVHLDAYVANGLVRGYSVVGRLRAARRVFDEVPERNAGVYTTMVSTYAQNGRHEDAMAAFDEMVRVGFQPCGAMLASVLSACARSASGGLEMGRHVHDLMVARGMAVGTILGTALIDMYVKNGAIKEAFAVLDGLPERRVPVHGTLSSRVWHTTGTAGARSTFSGGCSRRVCHRTQPHSSGRSRHAPTQGCWTRPADCLGPWRRTLGSLQESSTKDAWWTSLVVPASCRRQRI